mmetsp:Transcript_12069/g.36790  ORF Transcript_12069/g.36790 Transcript_12069/m.36790 type:complete len:93 (+) Transcript_12069:2093-2371(+)
MISIEVETNFAVYCADAAPVITDIQIDPHVQIVVYSASIYLAQQVIASPIVKNYHMFMSSVQVYTRRPKGLYFQQANWTRKLDSNTVGDATC